MLQGYSGKHWVQIPRKQAVFVHSWYSQSSPWEWREDEVYYVQRGCCRYVQSFIIRFFFLPQEAHQECFSERKTSDYFLFLLFCLWETEDVISPSSSELTLHPSTFTSTTFNLFVILRAWLSTLNAVDFLFLQLWAKWEKSKIKVGLWKSLKWDFEKKKRERIIIFQMIFILTGNTWPSPADRRVAAGAPSCCVPSFLLLLLEMFSFVLQYSSLADYKSSEHLLQQLSSFRFCSDIFSSLFKFLLQ